MDKISVIFPVYNGEEYIRESLESVLNQTYENFEVLCIYDDGTKDNAPNILKEIANNDKRVKVIDLKEKRGLLQALNHGISISSGKYIARADSDDICMTDRFAEQIKYFQENSCVDILGTHIDIIGDVDDLIKEKIKNSFNCELDISRNKIDVLDRTIIAHPTVMMKKNIFNKLKGYNEQYKEAEDYELWIRAVANGFKIGNVDKELVKYRVYSNSKSAKASNMKDYVMQAKLYYLTSTKKISRCCIWGASGGGKLAYNFIINNYSNMNVVGFIDTYKQGTFEQKDIYDINYICNLDIDYIFIATDPGKEYAKEMLKNFGLEEGKDYCYIL